MTTGSGVIDANHRPAGVRSSTSQTSKSRLEDLALHQDLLQHPPLLTTLSETLAHRLGQMSVTATATAGGVGLQMILLNGVLQTLSADASDRLIKHK